MHVSKLLSIITDSKREDWNMISGETFHSTFSMESAGNDPLTLHANAHYATAAYVPDASITIEFGFKLHDRYDHDWVKVFANPHASVRYLDMFYNGALIYRSPYVYVDGNMLPLPQFPGLTVEKGHCDLIKVIDRMGRAPRPDYDSFEATLRRAGFTVVNEEWPYFYN